MTHGTNTRKRNILVIFSRTSYESKADNLRVKDPNESVGLVPVA
jgi:hypothetical protein